MGRNIRRAVVVWIVGFGLACPLWFNNAVAQSQGEGALTVVYDSFAQFIYTRDGEAAGLYVDIINEALENRLGVPVVFEWQPWQRAQFSVEEGLADAMVTVPTPDRLVYAEPGQVPVAVSSVGLFTAADHPQLSKMRAVQSIDDLQGLTLLTYLGDGWAAEHLAGLTVDFDGKDIESVFQKLLFGRGDAFAQTEDVTRYYLETLNYQDQIIQVPGVTLGEIRFYLMIGRQSSYLSLLPKIDDTLSAMERDGTLKRMLTDYGYDTSADAGGALANEPATNPAKAGGLRAE